MEMFAVYTLLVRQVYGKRFIYVDIVNTVKTVHLKTENTPTYRIEFFCQHFNAERQPMALSHAFTVQSSRPAAVPCRYRKR